MTAANLEPAFSLDFDPALLLTADLEQDDEFFALLENTMFQDAHPPSASQEPVANPGGWLAVPPPQADSLFNLFQMQHLAPLPSQQAPATASAPRISPFVHGPSAAGPPTVAGGGTGLQQQQQQQQQQLQQQQQQQQPAVAPLNIQQQQLAELQRLKDMQRQLQEQQQLLEAQLQMAQQQQQLGLMSQAAPTSAASAGEGSPSLHHSSSGGSSAHTFPPVGEPAGFSASPATLDSVMSSLGYGTTITTAGPSVGPPRAGPAPVVASAPAPAAMTAGMPALMPPLALDAMAVNPLGGVNGSYQVYAQPASLPVALPQSQGLPLAPGAGPFVPGMPAAASIPSMPAASIPVSVPLAAGNNSLQLVSARPAAASFPPPGPQAAAAAGRSHAAAVAAAAVAATNQDPKLKGMGPSRRFRERQKAQISSLEAEVNAKLAELALLEASNASLRTKTRVLEHAVASREHLAEMIDRHGPPTFAELDGPASPPAVVGAPGGGPVPRQTAHITLITTSSHSESSGAESGCGRAAAAAAAAGIRVEEPAEGDNPVSPTATDSGSTEVAMNGAKRTSSSCGTSAPAPAAAAAAAAAGAGAAVAAAMDAADAEDAAVVAAEADATVPDECREHAKALVACGQLCEVNIDEYRCAQKIKSMSVAEAKQYWRLFVQYISEELLKVDNNRAAAAAAGRPSEDYSHGCSADSSEGLQACSASLHNGWACPTNRRLEALVKRHSQMCKFVAFFNPGVLYRMFEGTVEEEGGAEADPGEEHWRRVVGHIGLTAPQLEDMLAHGELYQQKLWEILVQRGELQRRLAQAHHSAGCASPGTSLDAAPDMMEVLEGLGRNLRKEHALKLTLNCAMWGKVLTGYQYAKAAFHSYPYFPDSHSMTVVLLQDAGKLRSPNGLHSGGAPTPPAAAGAGPSPAAWQQSGYQVPAIPVAP